MITKLRKLALGAAFFAAATPAFATPAPTPTPANDPCSAGFITGAIACQGYYDGNLITGGVGSATTTQERAFINLLLTGTPSTTDSTPTSNTSLYTGNYGTLNYSTVLGSIPSLNGSATLNFGSLVLNGLTVVGAHFGNNTDSRYNNVTAFWLVNLSSPTSTLYLANGQGSSNAQIFATQTAAVPEPATWALMLMGFGGMGLAMRRRRSAAALPQMA